MRIRVTTTTPGYISLITQDVHKASHGNLRDFPWCFKGNVEGEWRTAGEDKWVAAAAKAPGVELVMDCEQAYHDLNGGWSDICTASYIFDRRGTLAFLHSWASKLAAIKKATGKSVYGYPCYPGPQGLDISAKLPDGRNRWPDGRDRVPENTAFLMAEKALCGGFYAGSMVEAYIWADMEDFYEKVDAQLARCASVGTTPKIILVSAFYIRNQMDGPAASFIGEKLILETVKEVRDQGKEIAFFNPAYGPAMDAIAKASVDL